ncbi:hypothetical protein ACI7RC_21075, partial [Brevibacillus sp. B_LB10_24]|uniref:hypothetical protein n=1 Tax=Brevibacillus sp. B_LB10_24 TaxID=3380645 RepID=UPI0038BD1B82
GDREKWARFVRGTPAGKLGLAVCTTKNGTSTKNDWKQFNAEFGRQACAVFFRSDWAGVAKASARSIFLGLIEPSPDNGKK